MAIPTQFNINPSGQAGQPKWPRKKAVVFGVLQLQQLTQTSNLTNPNGTTGLNTTLKFSMPWQRSSPGEYSSITLEKFNPYMLWIGGMSDYQGSGGIGIPIIGGTNTVTGNFRIQPTDTGGKLVLNLIVTNNAGTLIDLFDLIGTSLIYIPEIRIYNAFIYLD